MCTYCLYRTCTACAISHSGFTPEAGRPGRRSDQGCDGDAWVEPGSNVRSTPRDPYDRWQPERCRRNGLPRLIELPTDHHLIPSERIEHVTPTILATRTTTSDSPDTSRKRPQELSTTSWALRRTSSDPASPTTASERTSLLRVLESLSQTHRSPAFTLSTTAPHGLTCRPVMDVFISKDPISIEWGLRCGSDSRTP